MEIILGIVVAFLVGIGIGLLLASKGIVTIKKG